MLPIRYGHSFFISPVAKNPISHFCNITCRTSLLKVFAFLLASVAQSCVSVPLFYFSAPQQFHHLHAASFVIRLASVLETVSFPTLVLSHVQAAEQNQDEPAACRLPVLTKEWSQQTSGRCRERCSEKEKKFIKLVLWHCFIPLMTVCI